MPIYKGQTKLRIVRKVNVDVSEATECLIKYVKPSGTEGQFAATAGDREIYYDVTSADEIDETGKWITWAHVTFGDDRSAPGNRVIMNVYEEGAQ